MPISVIDDGSSVPRIMQTHSARETGETMAITTYLGEKVISSRQSMIKVPSDMGWNLALHVANRQ
jgi:hypothetical protein